MRVEQLRPLRIQHDQVGICEMGGCILHPQVSSCRLSEMFFFFLPFGLVIPKEKKRCIPKFNFTLVILEVEKNNRKQLESARNNLEVQEATACEMIVK